MREKIRDLLVHIWLLKGTDEQLDCIEKKWGFEKFKMSYYLQEKFSKENKGFVPNLENIY